MFGWLSGLSILTCLTFSAKAETNTNLFELSLEDLLNVKVSVASKSEQLISEAPSTVTVFTRDEIVNMGLKTLEELVNFVPGFQSSRSEENGTLVNTISVRGRRTDYTSPDLSLIHI